MWVTRSPLFEPKLFGVCENETFWQIFGRRYLKTQIFFKRLCEATYGVSSVNLPFQKCKLMSHT